MALGTAAASLGIFAAPAQAASWESYLDSVGPNFESRRWYQGSAAAGTKIQFTGCTGGNVANVTLYKDIPYLPDPRYTMAAFTNCYNSSTAVSTGNWNDHGAADYYFVINEGAAEVYLSVRKVKVTY
ncbi:hypothetical protein GT204_31040 [Streptomyces sp. SID4919]|uniref:hypothetical protein n=1 Tax=unclassified Streptomyces TaxID=2593676 RepID=UPI0011838A56|nr:MULTISPECIES: hypothetical protein [unclassified Streptomyces]MYY13202.1 hypothetical protein [Streptomyces sp. SID4919]